MKLQLQLHTSSQGPAKAVFLRGKDSAMWLQQIQSWGIHPRDLEAYAVPQSIRDREIAGLLVILRKGHFSTQLELEEAYRCLGSALLIPQYCSVQPQIAEAEWPNILHYDWYFYHPGIGMVGFQRSDQVDLASLLTYASPQEKNWSLAQSGSPQPPALQHISVQMPKVEDIFAQVKGVGDQSLKDIPEKPAQNDHETGGFSFDLLNGLDQLLSQRGQIRAGEKQGFLGKWLDRLQGGIQQKIRDLQKQREDEISRLLKLFEEDPEEALRYSIPLNSPYEGRGIAPPSNTLGRKDPLDFNLGQLGSTGPRDNWDIDTQRRIALQQYYLKLANQKIAEKDFRKAAYIHAHLLGDFNTAANVLMQGKHYHEAALLYRDHLKNPQQAARCFEEGGLYGEAIPIYLELGEQEKAGDLYVLLDQEEEAKKLYLACVQQALERADFLGAARLYDTKLKDVSQAKGVLLQGWHQAQTPISCLNGYFDYFRQSSNMEFDEEIQRIYQQEVSHLQRDAFMNVLKGLAAQPSRKAQLPKAREIVYNLVSKELLVNRLDHLDMLSTFVPGDQLLETDISRLRAEVKERIKQTPQPRPHSSIHLVKTVELAAGVKYWQEARMLNHHLVVLGRNEGELFLQCADLEFFNECVRAEEPYDSYPYGSYQPHLLALPHLSPYLNIVQNNSLSLAAIQLIETCFGKTTQKYNLSPKGRILAYVHIDGEHIAKLELGEERTLTLHICNLKGEIKESFLCKDETGKAYNVGIPRTTFYGKPLIIFHQGYIYVPNEQSLLLRIDLKGITSIAFETYAYSYIYCITVSDETTTPLMAIHFRDPDDSMTFGCECFRIENNQLKSCGGAFEFRTAITSMTFIQQGLVLTHKNEMRLYKLNSNATPSISRLMDVKEGINYTFKGPTANQIGIIAQNGKVLFYEFDDTAA